MKKEQGSVAIGDSLCSTSTINTSYWGGVNQQYGISAFISVQDKIQLMQLAKELSKEQGKCFFKTYKKLLKSI